MRIDRRLILIGLAAWTLVALLYIVGFGFRRLTSGLPYYASWWQVWNITVLFYAGALLSLPLLLLFERLAASARRLPATIALYTALGLAYWVAWSLARVALELAGVARSSAPPRPLGEHLVIALVFTAYIALTLYVVMVMLYEAFRHLREARRSEVEAAQLETELAVAQAAALRARLNPGFLFGSFQIASELMENDVRAARKVISDLSELLRVSLGREGHELVPLRDELQLIARYLGIQRARPEWRARVALAPDTEAAGARVPPLLLQPLVESAVQEGLGEREEGRLEIATRRVDGRLLLTLTASAPGWPRGDELLERHAEAVERTRARLALSYGGHAELRDRAPEPGTLRVEMTIPEIRDEGMSSG
jgi:two-component system, LytTR family, sensor kinase